MYQVVGSGSGVMVVVVLTRLETAPLGPVVVLIALDLSGLVGSRLGGSDRSYRSGLDCFGCGRPLPLFIEGPVV